jgi:FAD/FMN-containing dehydrogenase
MDKQYQKALEANFGNRVSFEKTERLVYSHDTASLPKMVKQTLKTVPDAVVQPLSASDVIFITKFSREHKIPLTPRGAASSGWGGAIPGAVSSLISPACGKYWTSINQKALSGLKLVQFGKTWKLH